MAKPDAGLTAWRSGRRRRRRLWARWAFWRAWRSRPGGVRRRAFRAVVAVRHFERAAHLVDDICIGVVHAAESVVGGGELYPAGVARATVRVRRGLHRAREYVREAGLLRERDRLTEVGIGRRPRLREGPREHVGFRTLRRPPLLARRSIAARGEGGIARGLRLRGHGRGQDDVVAEDVGGRAGEAREDVRARRGAGRSIARGAAGRRAFPNPRAQRGVDVVRRVGDRRAVTLLPRDARAVLRLRGRPNHHQHPHHPLSHGRRRHHISSTTTTAWSPVLSVQPIPTPEREARRPRSPARPRRVWSIWASSPSRPSARDPGRIGGMRNTHNHQYSCTCTDVLQYEYTSAEVY